MKKQLYSLALMAAMGTMSASAFEFGNYSEGYSTADYREALNMGLKFFGGQRCGDTHNWMLMGNREVTKKYCHTKDGQGSVNGGGNGNYDLTGGWHDCGDHIKVGTTMGYAAVSLLVAYDLWPEAFQDNYDDSYGSPNGIRDVLDEVKVATDYFMKCFLDNGAFVYYVGFEGDHNVWVTSSKQSTLKVENGGDPRPVWTATDKGGPQAANYASALALMSMKYPDANYRQRCKEYALKAYEFAKKNKSQHASIPMFYSNPNQEWTDELALAAIMMYNMTGEEQYKSEAISFLSGKWESNSPLAWDTMTDFAYYYIAKADPSANNGQGGTFASFLEKNVFGLHLSNAKRDSNGFPYYTNNWGTNKLACGGAVAAALWVKLVEDGDITTSQNVNEAKNFNARVVDYVLGKNEFNHTFLHGFKGDMHFRIHHRNAMGRNDNPPTNTKNTCDYMFASGGLIGGPSSTGVFANVIEGGASYTETEGGCDYNAPFVAAIARLVAEKDPVDNTGVAEPRAMTERSFSVYPTRFDDYVVIDMIERAYDKEAVAELVTLDGKIVRRMDISGQISSVVETFGLTSGLYFLHIVSEGTTLTYKLIKE